MYSDEDIHCGIENHTEGCSGILDTWKSRINKVKNKLKICPLNSKKLDEWVKEGERS